MEPEIDSEESEVFSVSTFVSAFVDLQGQSERLVKFDIAPSTMTPEFQQWFKDTFGLVRNFRSSFYSFLAKQNLGDQSRLAKVGISKPDIFMQAIGDGLHIYTSLYGDTEDGKACILSLYDICNSCSMTFIKFLALGKPFRAGIDIGVGVEEPGIGIYGSSIAKAYLLESKKADFPIILIGDRLHEYVTSFLNINLGNYSGLDKGFHAVLKGVAEKLLSQMKTDDQGIRYLNYLHYDFTDILKKTNQLWIVKDAFAAIEDNISNFEGNNKKLHERYLKMQQFFLAEGYGAKFCLTTSSS